MYERNKSRDMSKAHSNLLFFAKFRLAYLSYVPIARLGKNARCQIPHNSGDRRVGQWFDGISRRRVNGTIAKLTPRHIRNATVF